MTGWAFVDDRRWVSAPNKIPHRDAYHRRLGGSFALGIENIRFISLRPITLNGRDLALIVISRNDGGYEYPAIYEGWYTYTTWHWYAVEWGSVAALLPASVAFNRPYVVALDAVTCGAVNSEHAQLNLSALAGSVVASEDHPGICRGLWKPHARIFPVEIDGQRHVRFVFFEGDGRTQRWNHFGDPLPYGMAETQPEAFDSYYYEVPLRAFDALVAPARERARASPPAPLLPSASDGPPPLPASVDPPLAGIEAAGNERTTTHRVRGGENITAIARRYGVTVRQIMDWNDLRSTTVRPGQRLRIQTHGRVGVEPEPEVFEVVEQMPELVGGIEELQRRVQYPEMARRAGIEGRVFVQFVVDEDGIPTDVRIIRGIGGGCDEEALRVIHESRFTPGLQRGRSVRVRMSLPVTFRLSEDEAAGTTGTSGLSIEGLGSRGVTCPRPRYPGVNGTVTYAVTFAPNGRYVSSRPLLRGTDARLDQAVRSVISGCRAQPLSEAASQVNQEGRVTFRFTD